MGAAGSDPQDHRLGPALVALADVDGSFPALDFARPAMGELSREFAATCAALAVGEGEVTSSTRSTTRRRQRLPGRGVVPALPPLARRCSRAPASVRDEWLRQVPADTARAEALVATHDRGFAVEIGSTPVARVRELVTLLGDDASARAVLDRLADELATHAEFLALQLEPAREYAVNVVNAPVFDHTGQVTLVLSLTGFGRPLLGAEALTAGDRLVAATSTLTTALSGRSRTSVS